MSKKNRRAKESEGFLYFVHGGPLKAQVCYVGYSQDELEDLKSNIRLKWGSEVKGYFVKGTEDNYNSLCDTLSDSQDEVCSGLLSQVKVADLKNEMKSVAGVTTISMLFRQSKSSGKKRRSDDEESDTADIGANSESETEPKRSSRKSKASRDDTEEEQSEPERVKKKKSSKDKQKAVSEEDEEQSEPERAVRRKKSSKDKQKAASEEEDEEQSESEKGAKKKKKKSSKKEVASEEEDEEHSEPEKPVKKKRSSKKH